jgi:flagellar motor switch protein FliM
MGDDTLSQDEINKLLGDIGAEEEIEEEAEVPEETLEPTEDGEAADSGDDDWVESETLSQNEINDLLGSIEGGVDEEGLDGEEQKLPQNEGERKRIKIYDFLRPDGYTENDMSLMRVFFENFADSLNSYLPPALSSDTKIDLQSIDQLLMVEYQRSIGNPNAIAAFTAPGYPAFYIETPPSTAMIIASGILGLTSSISEGKRFIESPFFTKIVRLSFLNFWGRAMEETWNRRAAYPYHLDTLLLHPEEMTLIGPLETILLASFQLYRKQEAVSMATVCLPLRLTEELLPVLGGIPVNGGSGRAAEPAQVYSAVRVPAFAEFPLHGVSFAQMNKWKSGTVVKLKTNFPGRYV